MDPALIVSLLLVSLRDEALQLLLADGQGHPGLPGVAYGKGESLQQAVNRLVSSLIDQGASHLEQLRTYGESGQPVRVVYWGLAAASARAGSARSVHWHKVAEVKGLPEEEAGILGCGLRRLRHELETSTVGFHLLPGEFTLSELQHAYEIILAEPIDKRNFRRRLINSGTIEATSHMRLGEGRPARLYRHRPGAVAKDKPRRLLP